MSRSCQRSRDTGRRRALTTGETVSGRPARELTPLGPPRRSRPASFALSGAAASHDGDENSIVVEIRKANELRPATVRISEGTTVT